MHTGRISGFTRFLGAPRDWDEAKDGHCGGLAIRDEKTTAGLGMTSAWFPTPEEIERIKAGAPIYLTVLGQVHPPVCMAVGSPPDAQDGPPRPSSPPAHRPVG
ncbi:MAG: hypothetical protein NUW01_09680 [Gemmatimonadaceae bacterium]|nr:hypothetical protein [Gemmatimonadaceae bacterium]